MNDQLDDRTPQATDANRGIDSLRRILEYMQEQGHRAVTVTTAELEMLIARGDLGGPSPEAERMKAMQAAVDAWEACDLKHYPGICATDKEQEYQEWSRKNSAAHTALEAFATKK